MIEQSFVLEIAKKKTSDLYVCFCGYEECVSRHSYGPAVRSNYIIHYVLSGRGYFCVDNRRYDLEAGQGFVIEPGIQTFYQADEKEPWTYVWVGFDGDLAGQYLKELGLADRKYIFRCRYVQEIKNTIMQMLENHTYELHNQFLIEGLLYQFLSILARDLDVAEATELKGDQLYVRKATEFIQDNYSNPVKVTDIADYVCINRSYLYTVFQRVLHMSPREYLANYRMTKAEELLLKTDYLIEVVAYSCGYQDSLVFSKAFKIRKGVTPSEYRRQHRKSS